jgi:hypothetical protein
MSRARLGEVKNARSMFSMSSETINYVECLSEGSHDTRGNAEHEAKENENSKKLIRPISMCIKTKLYGELSKP